MSLADWLQRQHKLGPALRERLQALAAKKDAATWRELQQTAVLMSEKAEGQYQVFGPLTFWRQIELLELAAKLFARAISAVQKDLLLTTDDQRNNAEDAVRCDQAINNARLARIANDLYGHRSARKMLQDSNADCVVRRCIERAESDASGENPQFAHQAGIASMFSMRLAAGDLLEFAGSPDPKAVALHSGNAKKYLGGETSQDRQAAYRSYLTYLAMIQFAIREPAAGRAFAKIALRSAKQHGDSGHAMRAGLVMLFGRFGNRVAYALGMLRDEFSR
ncbi:MAG TPA: hypothetical protein VFO38_00730 [Candidatus Saccharimonadales bacterium]|nr:hypothetical protein [Candidatus Saccharimonadales bacterium]